MKKDMFDFFGDICSIFYGIIIIFALSLGMAFVPSGKAKIVLLAVIIIVVVVLLFMYVI